MFAHAFEFFDGRYSFEGKPFGVSFLGSTSIAIFEFLGLRT